VRELAPMLRRLIGENVRLRLALARKPSTVRTDRGQVDQILVNLVVNARDAIAESGTITVETADVELDRLYALRHFDVAAGPYVMLSVRDDGAGMDADSREHAFDPFFTTKPQGKGTGLGLASVYGIVRQAGGHVWLDSEPGLGTIFKLYFPAVAADEPPDEPQAKPRRRAAPTRASARLLVVEDEKSVRELTRRVLERAGYSVEVVEDGAKALAALEAPNARFDAVVSDVVMPGLSGTALAEWLFEHRPRVGVVLLSGHTEQALDLAGALDHGASFLAKPVASEDLLAAVAAAVAPPPPGEDDDER
jgi:CheY-like chemotaxis protein